MQGIRSKPSVATLHFLGVFHLFESGCRLMLWNYLPCMLCIYLCCKNCGIPKRDDLANSIVFPPRRPWGPFGCHFIWAFAECMDKEVLHCLWHPKFMSVCWPSFYLCCLAAFFFSQAKKRWCCFSCYMHPDGFTLWLVLLWHCRHPAVNFWIPCLFFYLLLRCRVHQIMKEASWLTIKESRC